MKNVGNEIFDMDVKYENFPIEELECDRQTLIRVLIDASSSMHGYQNIMEDSLISFKNSIINSKEKDEMLIAKTVFASAVDHSGYQLIDDFDTAYNANGSTSLYDAIVEAKEKLVAGNGNGYMETLDDNGIKTKGVIAIFSDGFDNNSRATANDAKKAIEYLKNKEIIVAFVAFGDEAKGIADDLGIIKENILEVDATESDLRKVFMILSKSAISASKSTNVSSNTFFTV